MARVLFYVQYLKGIGHLQRARLIAEAAVARGSAVELVCGGLPLPALTARGAAQYQLPALQAGPGGFRDLRDAQGRPVDAGYLATRRDALLQLFRDRRPDVLLVETFPFGRRQLAFELLPLLEAARERLPRPLIVCSVRDILQTGRKPGRDAETVARLRRYFERVLVHGDPSFADFRDSFAAHAQIADMIHQTGLVAASQADFTRAADTSREEVLVSIGGGAVGPEVLRAALEARPRSSLGHACWRLLAGPNLPEADLAALRETAPEDVTIDRFQADFRRLLAAARLSISYAGYNTTADILRAGVPAVLVTYSGSGGETEQNRRAARMADLGLATTIADRDLTPAALAQAIDAAMTAPRSGPMTFDLDGAATSAELLDHWAPAAAHA